MLCGPVPDEDRTQPFMWRDQEVPEVDECTQLGVLVSHDGSQDVHFQRLIKQGNARVAAMKPLLTDAHLTTRIKRSRLAHGHCFATMPRVCFGGACTR